MVEIDSRLMDSEDYTFDFKDINPKSIHTFLLWKNRFSDEGSLDAIVNRPYINFKFLKFVPPRNSEEIYIPLGLTKPNLEVVLRNRDLRIPVDLVYSSSLYGIFSNRLNFEVISYSFHGDGSINLINMTPKLRNS